MWPEKSEFGSIYKRVLKTYNNLFLYVSEGVHAVLKTGNWVRYCIFDLATGKAEQENNFPTSSIAFLGQNERTVAIFTAGQVQRHFLLLKSDMTTLSFWGSKWL